MGIVDAASPEITERSSIPEKDPCGAGSSRGDRALLADPWWWLQRYGQRLLIWGVICPTNV